MSPPHYLSLFLKPSLKEQHLAGWWARAWLPGSQMGFTQIAVPTGLYLEAMPWSVCTQFYLLRGAGAQTQGIAHDRRVFKLSGVSPVHTCIWRPWPSQTVGLWCPLLAGPSTVWDHPERLPETMGKEGKVSRVTEHPWETGHGCFQGQLHLQEQ